MKILASCLLALALLPSLALAEKADRYKRVAIEADLSDGDASNPKLTGNVSIVQGTLRILSDTALVRFDKTKKYQATLNGAPVCFRQKKDKSDELLKGQADRVEYDQGKDLIEFFNNVIIHDGANEMLSDYVRYNMQTEKFEVRPKAAKDAKKPSDKRVSVYIIPLEKEAVNDKGEHLLKTKTEIETERHEPLASRCAEKAL
jgi:lipopolysaccharide export system protein LptA